MHRTVKRGLSRRMGDPTGRAVTYGQQKELVTEAWKNMEACEMARPVLVP